MRERFGHHLSQILSAFDSGCRGSNRWSVRYVLVWTHLHNGARAVQILSHKELRSKSVVVVTMCLYSSSSSTSSTNKKIVDLSKRTYIDTNLKTFIIHVLIPVPDLKHDPGYRYDGKT